MLSANEYTFHLKDAPTVELCNFLKTFTACQLKLIEVN